MITKIKEKFKILSLTLLIFIFFIISFMRIDAYKNDLTFATYTPYDRKTKLHFSYLHQIHLKNNNIHLAEKAIQEGLGKFPDYHKFYLLMSNIENKKNNFEQAEIYRTKARELSKDDPEFNFYAGKLFFQQAQYAISERYLIRSLDLGVSRKIKNQALVLLGRVELARNNIDKGIEYFEKPLINHKDYADSYFYLGKAFLLKKDKQKASEFFLKAIELDENYLEIIK